MKTLIPLLLILLLCFSKNAYAAITDPDVQGALQDLREHFYCSPTGSEIVSGFLDKYYFPVLPSPQFDNPCSKKVWGFSDITCSHDGITCIDNNVVGLDMPKLVKIPASIENLQNLESLRVVGLYLTDEIPASIGQLSKLKFVELGVQDGAFEMWNQAIYGNNFFQTLPPGEVGLTGSLPVSIEFLQNLEVLDLSGNFLTGSLPASLSNLSKLKVLDLGGNNFSGTIPAGLGDLELLEELDLGRIVDGDALPYTISNSFEGTVPVELTQLSSLTKLDLSYNLLTDELSPDFLLLTALESNHGINVKGNALYSNNDALVQFVEFVKGGDFSPQLIHELPIANAGPDLDVMSGAELVVFGAADLSAGLDASYQWQQLSGIALDLTDANTSDVSFIAPAVVGSESLMLELTVTDSFGTTDRDQVEITISQILDPPIANAGTNTIVLEGSNVTLDGSGSIVPEGSTLEFLWEQISGPEVQLNNANSETASFVAPLIDLADVTLRFRLTLTNQNDETSSNVVNVLVENEIIEEPESEATQEKSNNDPFLGSFHILLLLISFALFLNKAVWFSRITSA